MYISEVSGHHQATLAIEAALRLMDSTAEIKNINGFAYVYPILEKVVNKAYLSVIKRTPKVWDYLYDNPKVARSLQKIKEAIHKANHAKLEKLFREFNPDTVVCTQAFPCGLVADYKETYGLDVTVMGVLTDHAPHSYWLHRGVDYYIVPSQEPRDRFIEKGISEDSVKLFGIPVDPKFSVPLNRNAVAHKLGLNPWMPTVLVMGGGQGLGPIKKIIPSLLKVETDFQLLVVAGTNKKLIKWLKKINTKSRKKMIVYEFIRNIEELMDLSSLIITKPGGMTTSEALAKGLPLVIAKPLPGQEMYNTNFLIKKGAAIRINNLETIGKEVEFLLESPERLAGMRRAAREIGKPYSALDIAKFILFHHV